ncbi:GMC family oxidoreductase [Pseudonocardia kujensis]|uniref:FAD-dependent oxidoreductase n=1 Tax=Pseudonocardia kujensis TaxID=1128675 RepID=UPI001E4FABEC|nr:GMC family oxidoreductase [Pseudonocardia kujensis]MCE0763101.1 GMC family oxidoreductase [Pseudonocardia kujensis]
MLSDARELADDQQVEAEVCIVGAGPAGISIAREMIGNGARVVLLESGGRDPERHAQQLNRAQSVGYPIHRPHQSRVRAFGGTTRHWTRPGDETWAARPLDPIDFEVRPGIRHSGWPFGRGHLDPYYVQAQELCRLGPFDYDPGRWTDPRRTPPLPLLPDVVETTLFQHGTADFSGYYEELARAANVTLLLHATVVELATEKDPDCVDRVEVRREDGSRCSVRARLVVLAAGGIENPRLLLLSRRAHRHGLGNDHDLVGRFFAERMSARTGYIVPASPKLISRTGLYPVHEAAPGVRVQGALRVRDAVQREQQLLNCAFFLLPRPPSMTAEAVRSIATLVKARRRRPLSPGTAGHLRNIATGVGDLGIFARDRLRGSHGSGAVLALRAQGEQAPNPASRVMLGTRRDRFGLSVARVHWHPAASDRASIRATQETIDEALRRAGLGHVELMLGDEHPPTLVEGNFHHLGATRMHTDPAAGVVDADCRVHGVRNLYVTGSSVFPTYGCSNPTLTVVALALRLADHLKKQLAA